MLFNSIDFAIFLPIIFMIYWMIGSKRMSFQNMFIAVASYVFYGWWDWRFLSLIFISTIIDFSIGIFLSKAKSSVKRNSLLWFSIIVNIGLLGFFKYFNFFVDNFVDAFSLLGSPIKANSLNIILPVGISFYTFQTLSYTIDVYRKKIEPTRDFISFAAFVSFFPQLVAGPIERASNLLPQFKNRRVFHYPEAVRGCKQILWGFFKKLVIADNCAVFANEIFNNYTDYSGITLIIGAVFFAFQIYGDFSGYSDIAIGTARLFGFNLMQNFAFPYFSRDISEFWRRWHISLSTWFRDYVYIPLGGSRGNSYLKVRNILIIFLISGFWHGANWTFIFWGLLNALYFLPLMIFTRNRKHLDIVANNSHFPSIKEIFQVLFTFSITVFAWIFFRSENVGNAFEYISRIGLGLFSRDTLKLSFDLLLYEANFLILNILIFVSIEWFGRKDSFAIEKFFIFKNSTLRWSFYSIIVFLIGMYMQTDESPFIYFQF